MNIEEAAGMAPGYDFYKNVAEQSQRQKEHEFRVAEASLRLKQRREAASLGVNPEMSDFITVDEAVALLKANDVKQENIDEFVTALGDKKVVSRQALQAVILKKGGGTSGTLGLVGSGEGKPVQDPIDGKWYQTWKKRLPDLGMIWTDRLDDSNVPVFLQENPEEYAKGHKVLSIESPKLGAAQTVAQARKTLAEGRVKQYKIDNWLKLDKEVNPYTRSGAGALARSGQANQRADRAFGLLALPNSTWQDISGIVTDIAGILTGGVPQLPTLEDQKLANNVFEKWGAIKEFFTGARAEEVVPTKIKQQMYERLKEIKDIDNEIISKNIRITELAAEDIINTDRPRWEEMKQVLLDTTTKSDKEDKAYKAIFGTGASVPRGTKTPEVSPVEPSTAVAPMQGIRKTPKGISYTVEE